MDELEAVVTTNKRDSMTKVFFSILCSITICVVIVVVILLFFRTWLGVIVGACSVLNMLAVVKGCITKYNTDISS